MRLLHLLVLSVISAAGLGTPAAARETAAPLSTASSTSCVPMGSAPGAPNTGGAGIVVNVPVGPGQEPASVSPRRGGERVRLAQVANGKVVRGEAVLVTGENLPTDPSRIVVWLGRYKLGPPSQVSPDGTSLVFVVPSSCPRIPRKGPAGRIPPGRRRVRLRLPSSRSGSTDSVWTTPPSPRRIPCPSLSTRRRVPSR